jgi:ATP-binding cassette subfamily D (ALD) long-chain fatty acid import protein
VRAQPSQFFFNILRWLLVAIPATWTNSWLSYIQNKLAIAYRTRLTTEVMKQYLGGEADGPDGKVYYKLGESHSPVISTCTLTFEFSANLDDRIKNPDQLSSLCLSCYLYPTRRSRMITHDIQRFSTHLAAIYSNLAKPVLDVILYNYQLSQNVGAEGLLVLTILVQFTAVLREHFRVSNFFC